MGRNRILEKGESLIHSQLQYLGYILTLELDFQGFTIIALSLAHFTGNGNIRQKLHFNLNIPLATAGFTTATFNIEGEASGGVPSHPGFRDAGKKLSNGGKGSSISSRVAPGGTPDGRLVDIDHFINVLNAQDIITFACLLSGPVKCLCQLFI